MNESKLPRATHQGEITIGSVRLGCYVLDDGRRLVAQAQTMGAFGRATQKNGGGYQRDELARFFGTATLKPFAARYFTTAMNPVEFIPPGGGVYLGHEARVLVDGARTIRAAARDGRLGARYEQIAVQAEILLDAFAQVGVEATVDNACGIQRARGEYASSLEAKVEALTTTVATLSGQVAQLTATCAAKDALIGKLGDVACESLTAAAKVMARRRQTPEVRESMERKRRERAERERKARPAPLFDRVNGNGNGSKAEA